MTRIALLTGAAMIGLAGTAAAQDLRIGLQDDADILDPDLARTFVGRIVFTGLCDKLIDTNPGLEYVPELATSWEWSDDNLVLTMNLREGVVFHDGTPFDAEAVAYNIDRSLNLPGSNRRSEISAITQVEVVDSHTVALHLEEPFAPLLAALSDRAGMMISPAAAEEAGEDFGLSPVCSGPYKFVERVQQDRIALERFPEHWDADSYHFETVTYRPIPDNSIRLANLRSGDLDMIERVAATDIQGVADDSSLVLERATGLGYQGITINIANGPRADTPLGNDPRVREALELAIDRTILNQVAFDGAYTPGNQPVNPENPYYVAEYGIPERDVERARALLAEAGQEGYAFELMVANSSEQLRVGEIIQGMAAEAGFQVSLNATEFATALDRQENGDFEAFLVGWSGRVDPDGNIHIFTACEGTLNDGAYCNEEVDAALEATRGTTNPEERLQHYADAAALYLAERPRIYLYHPVWPWAMRPEIEGFVPHPDGMIRLAGMRFAD